MASMILLFILSFPQKPEWTTGLNGKQSKKKSVPPYSILKYFLRLLFPIPYQAVTILDWVQKFTMVLVFFAATWAGVTQAPRPLSNQGNFLDDSWGYCLEDHSDYQSIKALLVVGMGVVPGKRNVCLLDGTGVDWANGMEWVVQVAGLRIV